MNEKGFFIVGAGSFGTALAIHLARRGEPVYLWGKDASEMAAMTKSRRNEKYLPGIDFPDNLQLCETFVEGMICRDIFVVVPSNAFREVMLALLPHWKTHRLLWGTKGLDPSSGELLPGVVEAMLGDIHYAIFSGPSFAKEVASGQPTAVVIAGNNPQYTAELVRRISGDYLRAYQNDDVMGVSLGSAMKNVLAIAVGISDGLGFGANARSALMTRGMAEMVRLGVAVGGQPATFMGLAGMGDVILTCTDDQSRNRRFGLALGRSDDIELAKKAIGQSIEGVRTAGLIEALAKKHCVEVPITTMVCHAMAGKLSLQAAVDTLFARVLTKE